MAAVVGGSLKVEAIPGEKLWKTTGGGDWFQDQEMIPGEKQRGGEGKTTGPLRGGEGNKSRAVHGVHGMNTLWSTYPQNVRKPRKEETNAVSEQELNVYSEMLEKDKQVQQLLKNDDATGLTRWLETNLGADASRVDELNPETGLNILHVAAAKGKVSSCGALLKFGAQLNIPSRKGCQAIHLACRHGHVEVIKVLLGAAVRGEGEAGERVGLLNEATDDGWYPLHEAVWNNKREATQFLISHKHIDINVRTKVKLETALMLAVRSVNVFACEQLLANKKTAVEMQNSSGLTAFMVACASGHDSLFDLLVSRGAKVTTTSHRGATGAHLAARYGHVNILQKLNQIQPDLFECKTDDGWTCLHEASDTDNSQVAEYLLLHSRVDLNAQTGTGGNTALHVAAKKGHVTTFCTICSCASPPEGLNTGVKNRNKETVTAVLNAPNQQISTEQVSEMRQALETVRHMGALARNQTSTPSVNLNASINENRTNSSLHLSFASLTPHSKLPSPATPSPLSQGPTASRIDDVFLSYCWSQSELVEKIHARLSRKKFKVWMDKFRINPGDRLYDKLQEGISNCKVFVPCLSSEYIQSDNCKSEFHLAKLWKKPIVPLILDPSLTEMWPPSGELAPLLAPLVYLKVLRDSPAPKTQSQSTANELDPKQIDKLCEKVSSLETEQMTN